MAKQKGTASGPLQELPAVRLGYFFAAGSLKLAPDLFAM